MKQGYPPPKAVLRYRILEGLLDPGFYILLLVCMTFSLYLVHSFASAVVSFGIDYEIAPVLLFLSGVVESLYGENAATLLFAHGPFLLLTFCCAAPLTLYLSLTTILQNRMEQASGYSLILAAGPLGNGMDIIVLLLRNVVLLIAGLLVFSIGFIWFSAITNLGIPMAFLFHCALIFLTGTSVFILSGMSTVLPGRGYTGIVVFSALLILFILAGAGTTLQTADAGGEGLFRTGRFLGFLSPAFYYVTGIMAVWSDDIQQLVYSLWAILVLNIVMFTGLFFFVTKRQRRW
jgi:hypothetical protein